jgi:hypothetical protein
MIFGLFSSSKVSRLRQKAASDPSDSQCRTELADLLEKQADEAPRLMQDYGDPSAKEKYQSTLDAYQEACVLRMELVKLQQFSNESLKAAGRVLEKFGALNEFCADIERAFKSYGDMFAIYGGIIDRDPNDTQARLYLARSYAAFSSKLDPNSAASLLTKAKALMEPLVASGRLPHDTRDIYDEIDAKLDRLSGAKGKPEPEPKPKSQPTSPPHEDDALFALSTPDGFTLPVKTFDGFLKQHSINHIPVLLQLFERAYPGFCAEPIGLEKHEKSGNWAISDMSGKLRRYGGGPSLPRSRYYGVCKPNGSDGGGVAREIFAYARPQQTGIVLIDDMFDQHISDSANKRYGSHFERGPYFLLYLQEPERLGKTPKAAADAGFALGSLNFFRIPYSVRRIRLERIIDLRFLQVAVAFHEIFSQPKVVDDVLLPPTANFAEFLMLLLGQYRGGNALTVAIGRELRKWGVQGLIYPSARCDCAVQYTDRALTDWHGWNLVSYAGIPRDDAEAFDQLISIQFLNARGLLTNAAAFYGSPVDSVTFKGVDDGPNHGSWQVVGLAELNKQRWLAETRS